MCSLPDNPAAGDLQTGVEEEQKEKGEEKTWLQLRQRTTRVQLPRQMTEPLPDTKFLVTSGERQKDPVHPFDSYSFPTNNKRSLYTHSLHLKQCSVDGYT